jgi:hypothetical protein
MGYPDRKPKLAMLKQERWIVTLILSMNNPGRRSDQDRSSGRDFCSRYIYEYISKLPRDKDQQRSGTGTEPTWNHCPFCNGQANAYLPTGLYDSEDYITNFM